MTHPSPAPSTPVPDPGRRAGKVDARVALALLETLQAHDLPDEVLVDENLSVTLPRRLGLSRVVDTQVRRYREEVRRKHRVPLAEVEDLLRLVARRPDAAGVFLAVGRALSADLGGGWRSVLPRRMALSMARRRAGSLLRDLFGRRSVKLPRGEMTVVADHALLVAPDLGGAACSLVTGVLEGAAGATTRTPVRVRKASCVQRGDSHCRWLLTEHRPELLDEAEGERKASPGSADSVGGADPAARSASAAGASETATVDPVQDPDDRDPEALTA